MDYKIIKNLLLTKRFPAFSLIELMISLITISCITAAFTPIITKKLRSTNNTIIQYITSETKEKDSVEYTSAGEFEFTVPSGVKKIKATVISGGEGGDAGLTSLQTETITKVGESTFDIPIELRNKYAFVDICGGGGGGGGASSMICFTPYKYYGAGGGGSGGAYSKKLVKFPNKTTTYAFVGGGGSLPYGSAPASATPATTIFWNDCIMEASCNGEPINLYGVDAGSNKGGGAPGFTYNVDCITERYGGRGDEYNGGSGAPYLGTCGLTGAGGGGGGASRLGTSGESHYLYVGGGGGGGGEGVYAYTQKGMQARSGAGGGGGGGLNLGGSGGNSCAKSDCCGGKGGGAGKPNGSSGGSADCSKGKTYTGEGKGENKYTGYFVSDSGAGGVSPLTDYPNNCYGGNGEGYNGVFDDREYSNETYYGKSTPKLKGGNGIIAIQFLKAQNGGSGGASGRKITKTISVNAGEKYKIIVGDGANGGSAKYIDSTGAVIEGTAKGAINHSYIYKNSEKILGSDDETAIFQSVDSTTSLKGTRGKVLSKIYTCQAGDGGTSDSQNGENAEGYGGCGGGGGYAGANGGKGSIGYVLLEWEVEE